MTTDSKRALVTGGAGFIGSNVVDALLADGWEVDIVDDLSTGRESNVEQAQANGARLHRVDMRESEALRATVSEARPTVIFHLAAQIDVRRSVADPAFDARTNFEATYVLLEAARLAGVEHVVYSSTGGAIYGVADTIPTPEDAPRAPLAPYGQSKYAAEGAVLLYERLHGLGASVLRYGNVYGPRQDPLGEAGVVAIFCGRAVHGGEPIIYGDGQQTRDYVFVGDVVAANLAAAEHRATGPFNIGTGRETTVVELLETLKAIVPGSPMEPARFDAPRPGEVTRSCLDIARAERELGWTPATTLEDGLRITLEAV